MPLRYPVMSMCFVYVIGPTLKECKLIALFDIDTPTNPPTG